jgi:hypothetical protein
LKESTSEMNSPVTLQVDARKDVVGENLHDIDVSWKSIIYWPFKLEGSGIVVSGVVLKVNFRQQFCLSTYIYRYQCGKTVVCFGT